MIIGHLPAGYLLATVLQKFSKKLESVDSKWLMCAGLVGSIFPDFDMLYFYLIDHRQHHHHLYWTHLPIYWLGISLLVIVYSVLKNNCSYRFYLFVFLANIFLHLVLDTIVGDIWWFHPFIDYPYRLATVPALYHPWWLNFILHWSFLIEITVLILALAVFKNKRRGNV